MDQGEQTDAMGAPPRCADCGYNLTGLSQAGRCPECGSHFDLANPDTSPPRPMFGWLLLAVPPALLLGAWFVGFWTLFDGGCFLVFGAPMASLVLSVMIAHRLAQWRYGIEVRAAADRERFSSKKTYVRRTTVVLTAIQVGACFAAFVAWYLLLPWLTQIGLLPYIRD